jgi:hypothetical protein
MSHIRVRLRRSVIMLAGGHAKLFQADASKADIVAVVPSGQSRTLSMSLPIPAGLPQTLDAVIINCSYDIVVQAVTDGCCVSNIKAKLPAVYVYLSSAFGIKFLTNLNSL